MELLLVRDARLLVVRAGGPMRSVLTAMSTTSRVRALLAIPVAWEPSVRWGMLPVPPAIHHASGALEQQLLASVARSNTNLPQPVLARLAESVSSVLEGL
jgi:hypothetical protein